MKRPLLKRFYKIAENTLLLLPEKVSGLTVDYYEIMPTHLHVVLVLESVKLPLGEIIRRYKALVTKETKVKPFWEWNYYEHVIRSEKALYLIRKYIHENRENAKIDIESIYRNKSRINPTATKKNCSRINPTATKKELITDC